MVPVNDPPADRSAPGSHASEPVDVADVMPHSLHSAVYARRSEYIRPRRMCVKVGTWNVAACPGTEQDLAFWFVSGKGIDPRLSNIAAASSNGVLEHPSLDASSSRAGPEGDDRDDNVRVVGDSRVGLYVLGLQEVADLNRASQYMSRVYTDAGMPVLDKWKTALELALPLGYEMVATEQMSGLLLLIYASPEIGAMVSHTSTCAVGTGLLGMLGNKGAVSASIVFGEHSRMTFVNSHLSSGNDPSHAERRCWDVSQIENRTQFKPYNHPGRPETSEPEKISDADFAFWFGDLNFRLDDLPGDDIRHILTLHAKGEYDVGPIKKLDSDASGTGADAAIAGEEVIIMQKSSSGDSRPGDVSNEPPIISMTDDDEEDAEDNLRPMSPLPDPDEFIPDPSEDPASLQATLDSLLPHDQLRRMIKERKAFHDGWREGRITFLPSYKYDVGTVGRFDSSEKRRAPSWCDRILYRTLKDKIQFEQKEKDEEAARQRDEEMRARGLADADDDEVLFEYQPDLDEEGESNQHTSSSLPGLEYDEYDDGEENVEVIPEEAQKDADVDRIRLDIYTSHQRIQSSDHKPVVSLFTIDFDAAVPDLKAIVHSEVAKELDRTENESKPDITVVIDSQAARHNTTKHASGSDGAVDFGSIKYLQKAITSLTIANTGRVPAIFSFVEKPSTEDMDGSGSIVQPYQWLTTSFVRQDMTLNEDGTLDVSKEVSLEPGETVNALLEIFIDDLAFVRRLDDGTSRLEEVLVLRVVDGRDYFVPVRGAWLPTCIGRSVEELIRVPDGGIRAFIASLSRKDDGRSDKKVASVSGSISYELEVRCSAPKELFKLTEMIENLTERTIADEQMLEEFKIPSNKAGWPFEDATRPPNSQHIVAIIDALDNDRPISDAFEPDLPSLLRLEAVSHVLLLFLRGLADGIVTIPLWSHINQATLLSLSSTKNTGPVGCDPNSETDKNTVLDVLSSSPHHNIAFVFLTATLSRIIGELSPLSLGDLDALRSISRSMGSGFSTAIGGIGSIGRRSLSSFRKSNVSPANVALEALDKRIAREKRYAEIFSCAMFRASPLGKEKERKMQEDKKKAVVEMFLRRSREELG